MPGMYPHYLWLFKEFLTHLRGALSFQGIPLYKSKYSEF